MTTSQNIALRAAALVIRDHRVLLVSRDSQSWDVPGGRAEANEPITEAVRRECLEEAGVGVTVGPLCFTQETFFPAQNWRLVEMFFGCSLISGLPESSVRDEDGVTSHIKFFSVEEMLNLPIVRPQQLREAGWLESLKSTLPWGGSIIRHDHWKGAPSP